MEEEHPEKIDKCLRNLEPMNKHIEQIEAKRVGYAVSRAVENLTLASHIAGICENGRVVMINVIFSMHLDD